MSSTFEADESQIAVLLEELAAVTTYARELLDQVTSGSATVTAGWDGAAARSFEAQMARWQNESNAMVTEVDNFISQVSHAKGQYDQAGNALKQGWI
ncbi:WXG100 family type VII secretion target [Arthrobacter sp. ISL-48]|uniref:WXG100 family type VII secretion target n=1 Tax=Arthrobacter sp. ISL-48 TaxID=2819110 RepID=UPI001BE53CC5|nr:WXG100 family type VII secretion target [Arthrobacter sp. ISL-48]MBT2533899.1 WXG100 family type VII secretion target [Arthrobacter sp. ISL-48]